MAAKKKTIKPKRHPHSYKILNAPYLKSVKRAKKAGTTVANVVEDFIEWYGRGGSMYVPDLGTGKIDHEDE